MIVLAGCDAAVREAAFAAFAGRRASWLICDDAGDVARLASSVPILAAVVSDDSDGEAPSLCAALKRARPGTAVLYARRRGGLPAASDALAAGADELVDFAGDGPQRLTQRLRALTTPAPAPASSPSVLIDDAAQSLVIDGRAVSLTACEHRLFTVLFRRAGHVVPYDELLREALGLVPRSDRRTLHVHICHLRTKLGQAMSLQNRRGIGYLLVA